MNTISISEFYHDKIILITGATGFVGKVLLEKILREFTIKRIYVLIRQKNSQTPQQRLSKILSTSPIFATHKEKWDKIIAINGDITEHGLGLSNEDRNVLINEVNIVFHSAATITFDGVFQKFISQNINGTDQIMKLCQQMTNLQSIVYVSTAYANCHMKVIEEKIYPIVNDKDFESYLSDMIVKYGDKTLKIGDEALSDRPNPYTLSKSMAEWLIKERYSSLPIIICRPSIVCNSVQEPFPGWCDSRAALPGVIQCTGLGINQILSYDPNAKTDIIPVDIVCNALIISAAYRASKIYDAEKNVINVTLGSHSIDWKYIFDEIFEYRNVMPSANIVRPISIYHDISNSLINRMYLKWKIFTHYLFAIIFDFICILMFKKPFMFRFMKRIRNALSSFRPFGFNEWLFCNDNLNSINDLLTDDERKKFNVNIKTIDWHKYLYDLTLGCRRHILHESDHTIDQAKRFYKRLEIIYTIIYLIFISLLYFLTFKSLITLSPTLNYIFDSILIFYIMHQTYSISENIIEQFSCLIQKYKLIKYDDD